MQPIIYYGVKYQAYTDNYAMNINEVCNSNFGGTCSWCGGKPTTYMHCYVTIIMSHSQVTQAPSNYEDTWIFSMNGNGNGGLFDSYGLDFSCSFTVWYADPITGNRLPSCPCSFHVVLNDGVDGSQNWTPNCPCLRYLTTSISQSTAIHTFADYVHYDWTYQP